jgi:4'-phosphopantetheinyl transferase
MPATPDGQVTIWRLDLRDPGALPLEGLDAEEVLRGARLRDPEQARRWLAAHGAMRAILGRALGLAPGAVRFGRDPGGKPRLEPGPGHGELHFSLTHSGDWAWLALAPLPVGIDLEQIRPGLDGRALAAECCTAAEAAWLLGAPEGEGPGRLHRLWVRKEAVLKAAGLGLGAGLPLRGVQTLEASCTLEGAGTWWLVDLPAPRGYAGALAMPGQHPVLDWQDGRSL